MGTFYEKIFAIGKYTFYYENIPQEDPYERPGCTVFRVLIFGGKTYQLSPERDKYCTKTLIAGDQDTCIKVYDRSSKKMSRIFCAFNIYRAISHFAEGKTEHSVTGLDYDAQMCCKMIEYVAKHPGERLLFDIEKAIGLSTHGQGEKTQSQEELDRYFKAYDDYTFEQFSDDTKAFLLKIAENKAKQAQAKDVNTAPKKPIQEEPTIRNDTKVQTPDETKTFSLKNEDNKANQAQAIDVDTAQPSPIRDQSTSRNAARMQTVLDPAKAGDIAEMKSRHVRELQNREDTWDPTRR